MLRYGTLTRVSAYKWRLTDVTGEPAFWPHEGDTMYRNDIPWLRRTRGWTFTILEDKT